MKGRLANPLEPIPKFQEDSKIQEVLKHMQTEGFLDQKKSTQFIDKLYTDLSLINNDDRNNETILQKTIQEAINKFVDSIVRGRDLPGNIITFWKERLNELLLNELTSFSCHQIYSIDLTFIENLEKGVPSDAIVTAGKTTRRNSEVNNTLWGLRHGLNKILSTNELKTSNDKDENFYPEDNVSQDLLMEYLNEMVKFIKKGIQKANTEQKKYYDEESVLVIIKDALQLFFESSDLDPKIIQLIKEHLSARTQKYGGLVDDSIYTATLNRGLDDIMAYLKGVIKHEQYNGRMLDENALKNLKDPHGTIQYRINAELEHFQPELLFSFFKEILEITRKKIPKFSEISYTPITPKDREKWANGLRILETGIIALATFPTLDEYIGRPIVQYLTFGPETVEYISNGIKALEAAGAGYLGWMGSKLFKSHKDDIFKEFREDTGSFVKNLMGAGVRSWKNGKKDGSPFWKGNKIRHTLSLGAFTLLATVFYPNAVTNLYEGVFLANKSDEVRREMEKTLKGTGIFENAESISTLEAQVASNVKKILEEESGGSAQSGKIGKGPTFCAKAELLDTMNPDRIQTCFNDARIDLKERGAKEKRLRRFDDYVNNLKLTIKEGQIKTGDLKTPAEEISILISSKKLTLEETLSNLHNSITEFSLGFSPSERKESVEKVEELATLCVKLIQDIAQITNEHLTPYNHTLNNMEELAAQHFRSPKKKSEINIGVIQGDLANNIFKDIDLSIVGDGIPQMIDDIQESMGVLSPSMLLGFILILMLLHFSDVVRYSKGIHRYKQGNHSFKESDINETEEGSSSVYYERSIALKTEIINLFTALGNTKITERYSEFTTLPEQIGDIIDKIIKDISKGKKPLSIKELQSHQEEMENIYSERSKNKKNREKIDKLVRDLNQHNRLFLEQIFDKDVLKRIFLAMNPVYGEK